ncbi:DUF4179 domain-containing protein [Virgibacillus doumboii]|uniref:DUF4179 domain-containing protein n=1 Tax=Virgibacillus doumboii TaxID=2697503 RepID=UPI0013DFA6EA|nr:DUF4179 domain-containing protein [Virgibacillus doumboii]
MFEKEEENLKNYKKTFDTASVPLDELDNAISAGYQRAKDTKIRKPRKKKWITSAALVAVILIAFVTSVRVSPVFAQYVTSIPGMEKIVELIRDDKGMMSAVKNDYYQEIGVTAEQKDLKVTIDGAIADTNGLVLFYTLETEEAQERISIEQVELKSASGELLEIATMEYGVPHGSENGEKSYSGMVKYFFEEPYDSREFTIDLMVRGDTVNGEFSIPFKLNEQLQDKVTYKMNETVSIQGQKITFKQANVYPTRIAVHLKMDPSNTKKILAFEDLRLVDENGETWSKIKNGVTGTSISENEKIVYLQSNYFRKAEELTLVLSRLQAVDKDKSELLIDLEKGKILRQPEGNKLRKLRVSGNTVKMELHTKKPFNSFIFGAIHDANGNKIESRSGFSEASGPSSGVTNIGFNMKGTDIASPISVGLFSYPSWITEKVEVKIK